MAPHKLILRAEGRVKQACRKMAGDGGVVGLNGPVASNFRGRLDSCPSPTLSALYFKLTLRYVSSRQPRRRLRMALQLSSRCEHQS